MAYDNNPRGGYRERDYPRGDYQRGDYQRGDYDRGDWRDRGRRDERGFFERAGDEISSWFGDEEAERRREADERRDRERDRFEQRESGGWFAGPREQRDRNSREQRDQDRGGWFGRPDEARDRPRAQRGYGPGAAYGRDDYDRPRREEEYRPFAGDYGRGGGFRREAERNRGVGAGSRIEPAEGGDFVDPHYHEWRQRQIEELDRDYDEYRRENQSRFANEFSGWRNQRQSKRQLLGQVREHMEVVGSDEQRVGTVDRVEGDRVMLTRSDPEAGGVHRSLSCALVERVDGDRLVLGCPADEAKGQLRREPEYRDPARAAQQRTAGQAGETGDGPHVLERSFSGTYR